MKNKIIIGTANFGNRYGILKEKAKLGQIKKILNNGHKLGLRYLDAAEDYNSFNQIKKKAKKYNIFGFGCANFVKKQCETRSNFWKIKHPLRASVEKDIVWGPYRPNINTWIRTMTPTPVET